MNTLTRSMITFTAAAALCGIGVGVASAATPTATAAGNVPAAVGGVHDVSDLSKTTTGIHLQDASGDRFILTAVSGDNGGVPALGTGLNPGVSYQDFEVVFRAAKTTTVTADYNVINPDGVQLGTAVAKMSTNAGNEPSTSATFTAAAGGSLPLKIANSGSKTPQIQNSQAQTITEQAGDPEEQTLMNLYCQNGSNAKCTFTDSTEQNVNDKVLLADSYNDDSGSNPQDTSLTADNGYSASVTDDWGVSVSASVNIEDAVNLGVTASYGHSVTASHEFGTSQQLDVQPGYTGFIYAYEPAIEDGGTFTIQLGNSTWVLPGMSFDSPNGNAQVTQYDTFQQQGNQILPPAVGSHN